MVDKGRGKSGKGEKKVREVEGKGREMKMGWWKGRDEGKRWVREGRLKGRKGKGMEEMERRR